MMPYINRERRAQITPFRPGAAENLGELNYQITQIVLDYIERHALHYSVWAGVRGVLADVIDETRRRWVEPYEDKKREENGDVY